MQFMHSSATGCRPVASLGGGWARARRVRALLSSIAGSGSGCASYRPSYRGRSYASVTERGVPAPAPAREPHAHGTSQHCWQTETSGPPPDGGEEVGARPLASRSHDVISVSTGASALLLMRSSSALQRHARVGASRPERTGQRSHPLLQVLRQPRVHLRHLRGLPHLRGERGEQGAGDEAIAARPSQRGRRVTERGAESS